MSISHKFPKLDDYVSWFIHIPAGEFHLGASPVNDYVGLLTSIPSFSMGMTPVTNEMYTEYCQATGISYEVDNNRKYALDVSWNEIMEHSGFCEWASDVVGVNLTLPTNAEWEYAYRCGTDGLNYPWGNDFAERADFINRFGLSDMHGVVWQWCLDGPSEPTYSQHRWIRGSADYSEYQQWSSMSYDNPYCDINYDLYQCCAKVHESIHGNWDIGFRLCTLTT
jgi:formylglycine-generating enzyme required for sulfatase activity